jgi:hypothetical protein
MPPPDADPAWLDELALSPGPPWLSMGVRPLDLDEWLVLDARYGEELALKERLLAERFDEVFAARAGTEAASAEVLELVQAWLVTHGGHRRSGRAGPLSADEGAGLHPLDQAGRLVQEDLCLMVETDGAYRLEAASLCFPSHWRLHEKLGSSLAAIHSPVAHYDVELERRVDTFFQRLRADHPVRRRNLSIHNHDELFRPEPHETPDSFPPDSSGVERIWLRSERQTLLRLPQTGAVLFTIKTQQCPVAVLGGRPDIAAGLATRLRAEQTEAARRDDPIPFPPWLPRWLDDIGTSWVRTSENDRSPGPTPGS